MQVDRTGGRRIAPNVPLGHLFATSSHGPAAAQTKRWVQVGLGRSHTVISALLALRLFRPRAPTLGEN
jgi:hypothetical protein